MIIVMFKEGEESDRDADRVIKAISEKFDFNMLLRTDADVSNKVLRRVRVFVTYGGTRS